MNKKTASILTKKAERIANDSCFARTLFANALAQWALAKCVGLPPGQAASVKVPPVSSFLKIKDNAGNYLTVTRVEIVQYCPARLRGIYTAESIAPIEPFQLCPSNFKAFLEAIGA